MAAPASTGSTAGSGRWRSTPAAGSVGWTCPRSRAPPWRCPASSPSPTSTGSTTSIRWRSCWTRSAGTGPSRCQAVGKMDALLPAHKILVGTPCTDVVPGDDRGWVTTCGWFFTEAGFSGMGIRSMPHDEGVVVGYGGDPLVRVSSALLCRPEHGVWSSFHGTGTAVTVRATTGRRGGTPPCGGAAAHLVPDRPTGRRGGRPAGRGAGLRYRLSPLWTFLVELMRRWCRAASAVRSRRRRGWRRGGAGRGRALRHA